MLGNTTVILIAFLLYLIFMLLIGWYFYRRTTSVHDYIIAGRGLNSWVTSLSAQASDMSGWLMMGLPGYAFAVGLEASWIAIGLFVGTYLNWKFVARKLRDDTEKFDSITLPGYFENRYNDKNHTIRIVSAIFIIVFFLIYTSSGFVAGAKLFHSIFHVNYQLSLLITALIIVGYTFMGGLSAVSWTDLFQGILMFIAIVTVPLVTFLIIERQGSFRTELALDYPNHTKLINSGAKGWSALIIILSNLGWGLGYFGQPHILTRFMAIKSSTMIKKSRRIAMIWVLISLSGALIVGVIGRVFFKNGLTDPESVFLMLANINFPPIIAGIMLAAILAAVMSTADSQLLVTSSSVSEDLFRILAKKKISQGDLLRISRVSVLLVAVVSIFIAWNPNNSVLNLVAYAWAGFGATFGPLLLLTLYWKNMNRRGAVAAIVSGALTVLIWNRLNGGIFDLYEIIPGFIISFCFGIVFSINKKKDRIL